MELYDEKHLLALFSRLKSHDMSAFDEFYELTKKEVFYNILAIVKDHGSAEEVLQDTYVTFLERLSTIDADAKEGKSPLGYLFIMSRNKALKFVKAQKRHGDIEEVSNYEEYAHETKYQDDYVFKKMKEILKPKEYQIVVLHVLNGYTHKEIGHILHRPLGSITWAYANAIKKLQKGLGDYHG